MVFSSPIFLFLFLPVALTLYLLCPGIRLKNLLLLVLSVVFYAWGEPVFVLLALASTVLNYLLGRWVHQAEGTAARKRAVAVAVTLNVGLLFFYKYANFAVDNLNVILGTLGAPALHLPPVQLPLGISFFTFHALSYIIDIYRARSRPAEKPGQLALYLFLFPQLIAGPILRWNVMAPQISERALEANRFWEGVRRFVYGLSKKVLLANTLAVPADQVFSLPPGALSPALAWFGALCYTLQIYFDFSGYSDMAIGMGKMFGFEFVENFNFPYVSQSIREFWRRWHISLSTWFRDYLYSPLGGNRCSRLRTGLNLGLVFLLCGLWHGASWTFVVWGLFHGMLLAAERTRFGSWLEALPRPLRHAYALLSVVVGWVLFRADTLPHAVGMLRVMFGVGHGADAGQFLLGLLTNQVALAAYLGAVLATPLASRLYGELLRSPLKRVPALARRTSAGAEPALLLLLFVLCAAWLADGTYNPFIYFRF